ncbi:MAG: hypothetical protein AB7I19_05020 [Planctomycetota bacterium]
MQSRSSFVLASIVAATSVPLAAQHLQLVPQSRVLDLFVVDSTFDGVWRLSDRDQDGLYASSGEVNVYYDDLTGPVILTNPTSVGVGPKGEVYVTDSTTDQVTLLLDTDGNGDALGPTEAVVFFDGVNNGSGVVALSMQSVTVDLFGNLFVVNASISGGGFDEIVRLRDLNGDFDANDFGEADSYCRIPVGQTPLGDSVPTKVVVGHDLNLYYTDVSSTGVLQKGVYQIIDLNNDGDANDPGEVRLYWSPTGAANAFYWGLAVDRIGNVYVTDHGNEQVWVGRDLDNSGVIDFAEERLFYQTAASTWWDVIVHSDGSVYLCEDQTPDRITRLLDLNGDGDALDPNESLEVYDSTVTVPAVRPRGAAFQTGAEMGFTPNPVRIGQVTTLSVRAWRPGDVAVLLLSDALSPQPIPLPPFGRLEVNPALLVVAAQLVADSQAGVSLPLTIPNQPALVGSLAFQILAGDISRQALTNASVLIIQP